VAPQAEQETGLEQLRLAIPPEAGYIAMARMFAASVARHYGSDEDVVEDVKVAVSEACTNSVKAHRDSGTAESIELRARALDGELTFEIVDAGAGIDSALQTAIADGTATPAAGLFEGSLGLTLIRALFPGAEIIRNDDRGTTVRFAVPVDGAPEETEDLEGLPPLD
jgi:serine/threonine-protein kinase RsbW